MEFVCVLAPILINQAFRRFVDSVNRWHTPCRCSYLGVVVWGFSKETEFVARRWNIYFTTLR